MNPLSLTFSKDFINLKETVLKEEERIKKQRATRKQRQNQGRGNKRTSKRTSKRKSYK